MTKKINKQSLKNEFNRLQQQELLGNMPFLLQELHDFFTSLNNLYEKEGCNHTLKNTIILLEKHSKFESIIEWFKSHGGYCDCEILLNVTNTFDFVLNEFYDEKSVEEVNADAVSRNRYNEYSQPKIQKATQFITQKGLCLTQLPKQWTLCNFPTLNTIEYAFCLGKMNLRSTFVIYYIESDIDLINDDDFIDEWFKLTELSAKSGVEIGRKPILLGDKTVNCILVKSLNYLPCFIWIFDPNNKGWHMFIKTQITRLSGDMKELSKLLGTITYN